MKTSTPNISMPEMRAPKPMLYTVIVKRLQTATHSINYLRFHITCHHVAFLNRDIYTKMILTVER